MRKLILSLFAALCMVFAAAVARADVLILAHGYLGSSASWEASGVVPILAGKGWERAGILSLDPGGVHLLPGTGGSGRNKIYLVDLPSAAPLGLQADHLAPMLRLLAARHPKEKFILVGHSVGGLVLRLALVRGLVPNPAALVTIASPHLGTPRAEQALHATNDIWPVEVFKDFFGGGGYKTLKYSRGLYVDIVRPWPGSLLYWLNLQRHPKIHYVSVARGTPFFLLGDLLVPGPSQDMNRVPALRGRSTLYTLGTGHELNPADGFTLVNILKDLSK
ncbi:MAG: alpha/beta fold hydrolase [Magnetococcales bacterium]|nr:alpha/beta fold hydrolase [Magnetococcales bacterium]